MVATSSGAPAPAGVEPTGDLRAASLARLARRAETVDAEVSRHWDDRSGHLEEICRYAMLPSGKLFRPALLLESALAVGGDESAVLAAAVGTECGHVASLVHDDIIDEDDMRRGRPAVPAKFGLADAIVAGDLLIFRLFENLARCHVPGVNGEQVATALRATAVAGIDLCLGQGMEAELTGRLDCREEEYVEMVRLKTGALFRGSCEVGAILGRGDPAAVTALATYGSHLGIAFQICDDLLGYTSDPATTGKAAGSDLRNRRLTLPLIILLRSGNRTVRGLIERVFAGVLDDGAALRQMAEALHEADAVSAAHEIARRHCALAVDQLAAVPDTPSRVALQGYADAAVDRSR